MRVNVRPLVQEFKLSTDPDGEASVTIRQARTGDTIRRAQLFQKTRRVHDSDDGVVALEQWWNYYEQMRFEVYLTLVGATGIVDENDNSLFLFKDSQNGARLDMSQEAFNRIWGLLPDEVAEEIHGFVLEMNPQWNMTSTVDTEGE